jgi:hypothetical protein
MKGLGECWHRKTPVVYFIFYFIFMESSKVLPLAATAVKSNYCTLL